jgi:hypothetical protein
MLTAHEVEQHFETASGDNSSNSYFVPRPILAREALYGLAGRVVDAIYPHSEADEAGLLVHFLVAFGNIIGRNAHFQVEFTKHYCNLFAACVGSTGGGKGMCWSTPRYLFSRVDSEWEKSRVTGGLSSGEGIVHELRDPVMSADGTVKDTGAPDKRLFLLEEELGQGLRAMMREGSILSPILRQAWDSGSLHPIIKNNRQRATDAHHQSLAISHSTN